MKHGKERRKFERTAIDCAVRFTIGDGPEATGRLINISEGGLAIATEKTAVVGESALAYPEGLGRLAGEVVRVFDGGFAMALTLSDIQRAHLAKRILAAKTGAPYLRLLERRAGDRVKLNLPATALLTATSETFACEVLDLSAEGAGVKSDVRPALGEEVKIGALQGRVCRHTTAGFAIRFAKSEDAPARLTA